MHANLDDGGAVSLAWGEGDTQAARAPFYYPGVRFLARLVDFSIYKLVWDVAIALVTIALGQFIQQSLALEVGGWLSLSLYAGSWIILEGMFFRLFGNTPGKRWLGIQVWQSAEERPSWREKPKPKVILKRGWRVFWRGLGLGIPILSWVCMATCAVRLMQTRQTSWDREAELRIQYNKIHPVRIGLVMAYLLVMIALRVVSTS